MPLPIVPILIGALVLLAGRGGKKNGKPPDVPPGHRLPVCRAANGGAECGPGAAGDWVAGEPCPLDQLGPGEFGAFDHDGGCVIFWTPATRDAFAAQAQAILQERGIAMEDACAPDEQLPNGDWLANPHKSEVLRFTLARLYQSNAAYWPPVEESPFWIHKVWALGQATFEQELCGY